MAFPQTADGFVRQALTQSGDTYVFGAEASANDPNPGRFDCSELVEWSLARIGLRFVDGAENQYNTCKRAGTLLPIDVGVRTRGALLWSIGPGPNRGDHVAISQGNGQTIEARGRAYGVGQWSATSGRRWTHAGMVPGLAGYDVGSGASAAAQADPIPAGPTPEELEAMRKKQELESLAAIVRSMRTVVRLGSTGEAVTVLQTGLQRHGYWSPVTGVFDNYTRSIVQQFQVKNGKRADGVVNRVTWARVFPEFVQVAY